MRISAPPTDSKINISLVKCDKLPVSVFLGIFEEWMEVTVFKNQLGLTRSNAVVIKIGTLSWSLIPSSNYGSAVCILMS